MVAPPGLKGLIVADTHVGGVRGQEGFFHYRQYDATEVARSRSFEDVVHLLLAGRLAAEEDTAHRQQLAEARALPEPAYRLVDDLARQGHPPLTILRTVLSTCLDPTPVLDLDRTALGLEAVRAIGMAPSVLARCHHVREGQEPLEADPTLPHVHDYLRMLTGRTPDSGRVRAVERYMSLTADHGFNASTFTARGDRVYRGECRRRTLGGTGGPFRTSPWRRSRPGPGHAGGDRRRRPGLRLGQGARGAGARSSWGSVTRSTEPVTRGVHC